MENKKHIIIYSHGNGTRKDDNGLLSEIAENLPEVESILFDYFKVDENEHKIFISPLSSLVNKLTQVIEETKANHPEAVIDLICHSAGTIVAAMAKPEGIRKAVLLTPIFDMGLERTLVSYRAKSNVKLDLEGTSVIPSSTGLTKIIPKEYWQERLAVKPFIEYNAFAKKTEIIVIKANQDNILPAVDLRELDSSIKIISLDGDHGFHASARNPLIQIIRGILL